MKLHFFIFKLTLLLTASSCKGSDKGRQAAAPEAVALASPGTGPGATAPQGARVNCATHLEEMKQILVRMTAHSEQSCAAMKPHYGNCDKMAEVLQGFVKSAEELQLWLEGKKMMIKELKEKCPDARAELGPYMTEVQARIGAEMDLCNAASKACEQHEAFMEAFRKVAYKSK